MTNWNLIRERLSANATDALPNYCLDWVQGCLGPDATEDDAHHALKWAEEWFSATSQEDVLRWYADYRDSNPHAPAIVDDDGRKDVLVLLEDWEIPIVFSRAVSTEDIFAI